MSTSDDAGTPSRVLVAVRVDATPERAFAAFTGEIARWWRPNRLFQFSAGRSGTLAFEPGPSGRLLETYDDGSSFVIGEVRTWEPPHRLVVGWRHDSFAPEQGTELHVRFEPVGSQTRVTVEPGVYLPGHGGVRIEDTLIVTDDEPELLTLTSKELLVL